MANEHTQQIDIRRNNNIPDHKIEICAINVNSLAANKKRNDLLEFINNNHIDIAMI